MLNKILCVEDDRLLQCYYKRMMERVSFAEEIIQVYNGREALDYCSGLLHTATEKESLDLILLDLEMPVLGGRQFLKQFGEKFKSRFPETRIVILTSAALTPSMHRKVRDDPFVLDYLNKPLTFGALKHLEARLSGLQAS